MCVLPCGHQISFIDMDIKLAALVFHAYGFDSIRFDRALADTVKDTLEPSHRSEKKQKLDTVCPFMDRHYLIRSCIPGAFVGRSSKPRFW